MRDMLPACFCIVESDIRFDWMYYLWLFCWDYVAGTISISSERFPAGGTAMFALLAMAGDLGGSIGPGIVGRVTQSAGDNIRAGMGVGLLFPVILLIVLFIFARQKNNK